MLYSVSKLRELSIYLMKTPFQLNKLLHVNQYFDAFSCGIRLRQSFTSRSIIFHVKKLVEKPHIFVLRCEGKILLTLFSNYMYIFPSGD